MISKKLAKKFIGGLSGLPGWPRELQGQGQLVEALAESASSEAQAERIVNEFAQHGDRCPIPADLRRQAVAVRQAVQTERQNCEICGGVGFTVTHSLHTADRSFAKKEPLTADEYANLAAKCPLPQGQQIYTGAVECVCHPHHPERRMRSTGAC